MKTLIKAEEGTELKPVGTNRTYGQTIIENLKNGWEAIRSNPFINTFIPLEDAANGNYAAVLLTAMPGSKAVKPVIQLAARVISSSGPAPVGDKGALAAWRRFRAMNKAREAAKAKEALANRSLAEVKKAERVNPYSTSLPSIDPRTSALWHYGVQNAPQDIDITGLKKGGLLNYSDYVY